VQLLALVKAVIMPMHEHSAVVDTTAIAMCCLYCTHSCVQYAANLVWNGATHYIGRFDTAEIASEKLQESRKLAAETGKIIKHRAHRPDELHDVSTLACTITIAHTCCIGSMATAAVII
jgi:hypothetical protein